VSKLPIATAGLEILTGLLLLVDPTGIGHLLLGTELLGVAVPVARVAGLGMIGVGVACWPGPPLAGMLIYGAGVAFYLAYLALVEGMAGILLWPAVLLHLLLSLAIAWTLARKKR
jgi:hypothetical protein